VPADNTRARREPRLCPPYDRVRDKYLCRNWKDLNVR
jgi:hypothetical protein